MTSSTSGDFNSFRLPTEELLKPERMSDEKLRIILQQRGADIGKEVDRPTLLRWYDDLVRPKPQRKFNPNNPWDKKVLAQLAKRNCVVVSTESLKSSIPNHLETTALNGNRLVSNCVHNNSIISSGSMKKSGSNDIVLMESEPSKSIPLVSSANLKRSASKGDDEASLTKRRHKDVEWP